MKDFLGKTGDGESDRSLGERIDQALGDFEARLAGLREELELRRADVSELETEIDVVEKEQAKAFKDLMSRNTRIKRLLNPRAKSKGRPSSKRRSTPARDAKDAPDDPPRKQHPVKGSLRDPDAPWN